MKRLLSLIVQFDTVIVQSGVNLWNQIKAQEWPRCELGNKYKHLQKKYNRKNALGILKEKIIVATLKLYALADGMGMPHTHQPQQYELMVIEATHHTSPKHIKENTGTKLKGDKKSTAIRTEMIMTKYCLPYIDKLDTVRKKSQNRIDRMYEH